MTVRSYLTILSVLTIIYGVGFLLFPGPTLAIYGSAQDPHALLMAQFFGAALLTLATITWFAREFESMAAQKILVSSMVANFLFVVLNILGMVEGLTNAAGWSSVVLSILLFVGALYLYRSAPVGVSETRQSIA
jgi:hypothetical protein